LDRLVVGRRQITEIGKLYGAAQSDSFIRFKEDKERELGRDGDDQPGSPIRVFLRKKREIMKNRRFIPYKRAEG
jgi:hypothetical protein